MEGITTCSCECSIIARLMFAGRLMRHHAMTEVRAHCRDVKPSNILLTEDRRAKVSDMGLSRADFFSTSNFFAGTFIYAAPEVLLGRPSGDKVRRHRQL